MMKRASHFLSHVVHGHNAVQILSCLLACFWLNLTELSLCAQEGAGDRSQTLVWQRSHALMLENMGFFLDGAVDVDMELGQVQWKTSEAAVFRRLERIVQEVASLQALPVPWTKGGFSNEIKELIGHVGSLDYRDLRRWRMAENLSEKEQWYVLVQSGLDELKMQLAMELNYRVNVALYASLKAMFPEQGIETLEVSETDWLTLDPGAALPSLALELSAASSGDLSVEDRSVWPPPESPDLAYWMERVLFLLEGQERRIMALESFDSTSSSIASLRPVASDPSLGQLRLPQVVAIQFASGSASMDLNAQLQLNEVMELLCRHPQIRVVCTGHADAMGSRAHNHGLSKLRARAAREYILQSGLAAERVLLNYFGEERMRSKDARDRRVEIRFYVE